MPADAGGGAAAAGGAARPAKKERKKYTYRKEGWKEVAKKERWKATALRREERRKAKAKRDALLARKPRKKTGKTKRGKKPRMLAWAGSKHAAAGIIAAHFPKELSSAVSPFFGSGAVEFVLASRGMAIKGFDASLALVTFWQAVLETPQDVAQKFGGLVDNRRMVSEAACLDINDLIADSKRIPSAFADMDRWKQWVQWVSRRERDGEQKKSELSIVMKSISAARFMVANHCGFGSQMGTWALANACRMRDTRDTYIEMLRNFKQPRVGVSHGDCFKVINDHPDEFLFLDPPYLVEEHRNLGMSRHLYTCGLNWGVQEHERLRDALARHRKWIFCHADCPAIRRLYADFTIRQYSHGLQKMSAGGGHNRLDKSAAPANHEPPKEVLIFSKWAADRIPSDATKFEEEHFSSEVKRKLRQEASAKAEAEERRAVEGEAGEAAFASIDAVLTKLFAEQKTSVVSLQTTYGRLISTWNDKHYSALGGMGIFRFARLCPRLTVGGTKPKLTLRRTPPGVPAAGRGAATPARAPPPGGGAVKRGRSAAAGGAADAESWWSGTVRKGKRPAAPGAGAAAGGSIAGKHAATLGSDKAEPVATTRLTAQQVEKHYTERKEDGKPVWDCNYCTPETTAASVVHVSYALQFKQSQLIETGKYTICSGPSQPALLRHMQAYHGDLLAESPAAGAAAAAAAPTPAEGRPADPPPAKRRRAAAAAPASAAAAGAVVRMP